MPKLIMEDKQRTRQVRTEIIAQSGLVVWLGSIILTGRTRQSIQGFDQ